MKSHFLLTVQKFFYQDLWSHHLLRRHRSVQQTMLQFNEWKWTFLWPLISAPWLWASSPVWCSCICSSFCSPRTDQEVAGCACGRPSSLPESPGQSARGQLWRCQTPSRVAVCAGHATLLLGLASVLSVVDNLCDEDLGNRALLHDPWSILLAGRLPETETGAAGRQHPWGTPFLQSNVSPLQSGDSQTLQGGWQLSSVVRLGPLCSDLWPS